MSDFEISYNKTLVNEGGYLLHKVDGDSGGVTFAGITKKYYPKWEGWQELEKTNYKVNDNVIFLVKSFYREKYWDSIMGDDIKCQSCADTIFDHAVNSGVNTSVRLAQVVLGVNADGYFGRVTLKALNNFESDDFNLKLCIAKVIRYTKIVSKDRSQSKFLLGWINRSLRGLNE